MSQVPIIDVQSLSKSYKLYPDPVDRLKEALHPLRKPYHSSFAALTDVSFQVQRGETVGVIGPNGSGKSTLLKIISGVLQPSSGSAIVDGKVSALLELGAGFNADLSGLENVYLSSAIMGYARSEIDQKLDQILGFADIGDHINQPLKTYSSGMHVRLAFAVATSIDPDVLIVDEALSVGDMFFQAKCMKKMKHMMDSGCTTLFVSHDMGAVKSLCSRALYLVDGNITKLGDSGEVCDLYVNQQMNRSGSFGEASPPLKKAGAVGAKVQNERMEEFHKRVQDFRDGTGAARVVHAGIFNIEDAEVAEVPFGMPITLKAGIKIYSALEELVVAFYIKDKNQVEIMGTNSLYEGVEIKGLPAGNQYEVSFEMTNHLKAGNYSIQILLTNGVNTTQYFDWVDNAVVFKASDLPNQPRWALHNPPIGFTFTSAPPG